MKDFRNGKKPLRLLERIITLFTDKNDIVLDFFGGSGTTGQAVMNYSKKSGINRKFILVQLQENLDEEVLKQRYQGVKNEDGVWIIWTVLIDLIF